MQIEGLEAIREDHHGENSVGSKGDDGRSHGTDSAEKVFRRLALVSRAVVVVVLAVSAATTARLAFKILAKDEVDDFSTSVSSYFLFF